VFAGEPFTKILPCHLQADHWRAELSSLEICLHRWFDGEKHTWLPWYSGVHTEQLDLCNYPNKYSASSNVVAKVPETRPLSLVIRLSCKNAENLINNSSSREFDVSNSQSKIFTELRRFEHQLASCEDLYLWYLKCNSQTLLCNRYPLNNDFIICLTSPTIGSINDPFNTIASRCR